MNKTAIRPKIVDQNETTRKLERNVKYGAHQEKTKTKSEKSIHYNNLLPVRK